MEGSKCNLFLGLLVSSGVNCEEEILSHNRCCDMLEYLVLLSCPDLICGYTIVFGEFVFYILLNYNTKLKSILILSIFDFQLTEIVSQTFWTQE